MTLSGQSCVRVRYAETDQMGIVYHSNYLVWFEVGRTELFRELGLPYSLFEEQGLGLAVVEATCRYRQPAKYDDELIITTTLVEMSSRKVVFSYEVSKSKKVLAEGRTIHLFINKEGRVADARHYPIWAQAQALLSTLSDKT